MAASYGLMKTWLNPPPSRLTAGGVQKVFGKGWLKVYVRVHPGSGDIIWFFCNKIRRIKILNAMWLLSYNMPLMMISHPLAKKQKTNKGVGDIWKIHYCESFQNECYNEGA